MSAALVLAACAEAPASEAPEPERSTVRVTPPEGDAARGASLVPQYECNRCHDGTGISTAPREEHCVDCHGAIREGSFEAPPETLARWRGNLRSLNHVPSLAGARRLRPEWVAEFLQHPYDLRPGMLATMPRLPLDARDARDLAAHLWSFDRDGGAVPARRPAPSSTERGRRIFSARGCGACHAYTGVIDPVHRRTPSAGVDPAAIALAPDLRHARRRLRPETMVAWLENPRALKPDAVMPAIPLSRGEAEALAAFLSYAELEPVTPVEIPPRLPVLDREVSFEEVRDRVFRRVCWHCHASPDFAFAGDGGPGNTGGFGFEGRGVNLADYRSIASGMVDADGRRRSLFRRDADGTPHLLGVLLARQREVAGEPVSGVRGMPLGLPPLPPEDIQLLETWIEQGRPQ